MGRRLAVPAGTSVRFEPGISMDVELVAFAGEGVTAGFRGLYSARRHATARRERPDPVPGAVRRALRPDRGRPHPPGRHRPAHRDRGRPVRRAGPRRRRGRLRRRQGHPRVHGPVAAHRGAGRAGPGDHRCGRAGPLGDRQGRRRHQGRSDRGARQGRQPRHDGRRPPRPGDRAVDRGAGRQRQDPDRRRHRLPRPPHLPADPRHRARDRDHDGHRRRHRTGRGHQGHHRHRRALLPVVDAHLDGRLAHQPGAARQGQHGLGRRHVGAAAGRRQRLQAPRGLGLHARRHRRLPAGVRRGRGPGVAAHRHAERGRLRRDDARARSPVGRSTRTTPRARAAATPPTSSPSPACPTCCRARPTRPGPTR